MKSITFAIPCYNSAAYMDKCIESILSCGGDKGVDDIEIIIVDDGSVKDDTAEKADRWEQLHPGVIKAVHQENGGHGQAVNTGLTNASGLYFKVVDSDDWLDRRAMEDVMAYVRSQVGRSAPTDLVIANYVYEKVHENTRTIMHYRNVFPEGREFGWSEVGHFNPSQYLLMHSVIYRTELLRSCGLELPKHTFYVDNIFVYQPLPAVKNMYYMDVDLYRYFIGRADQSVNEKVMVTRVDQQLRVTYHMIGSHDLRQVSAQHKKLGRYMFNYLAMMMAISSIFLIIDNSPEALGKRTQLWEYLRTVDSAVYHKMKYRAVSAFTNFPGYQGRKLSVQLYRLARKIYKFN